MSRVRKAIMKTHITTDISRRLVNENIPFKLFIVLKQIFSIKMTMIPSTKNFRIESTRSIIYHSVTKVKMIGLILQNLILSVSCNFRLPLIGSCSSLINVPLALPSSTILIFLLDKKYNVA